MIKKRYKKIQSKGTKVPGTENREIGEKKKRISCFSRIRHATSSEKGGERR